MENFRILKSSYVVKLPGCYITVTYYDYDQ